VKILLIIDHFGSGGAQKQIVNLALGLKNNNHNVEFFIYHPKMDFFKNIVDNNNIKIHKCNGNSLRILLSLIKLIRSEKYDAAISYLDTPNIYLLISSFFVNNLKIIISERSSYLKDNGNFTTLKYILYSRAEQIITNNYSQAIWLKKYNWLKDKIHIIYNGYPKKDFNDNIKNNNILLAIGRVGPEKNALNLMIALEIFYKNFGWMPFIYWAGKIDNSKSGKIYNEQLSEKLTKSTILNSHWVWLGERKDIDELIYDCTALIHPSLYEGLPNVVCESMMLSKPILVSNVCDHSILVENKKRGFLFNPNEPVSISNAMNAFFSLNELELLEMKQNSFDYAKTNLTIEKMISSYLYILNEK